MTNLGAAEIGQLQEHRIPASWCQLQISQQEASASSVRGEVLEIGTPECRVQGAAAIRWQAILKELLGAQQARTWYTAHCFRKRRICS